MAVRVLERQTDVPDPGTVAAWIERHQQLTDILDGRLGRDHASLLARPRLDQSGALEWTTGLGGDIAATEQLPEPGRAQLTRRLQQLGGDIAGTAAALAQEGPIGAEVARQLAAVVAAFDGARLYSVGGKPVLTGWTQPSPVPQAQPAAAAAQTPSASSPAPTGSAAGGTGGSRAPGPRPAGGPTPTRRTPAWVWALNALAFTALLATAAAWLVLARSEPGAQLDAAALAKAAAARTALREQLATRQAEVAAMRCVADPPPDPLADLKALIQEVGTDCPKLDALLKTDVRLARPEAAELKAAVETTLAQHCTAPPPPEPAPAPPPPAPPAPLPEPPAASPAPSKPPLACPGKRPPAEIPEVALVLDASGSMAVSAEATQAQIDASLAARNSLRMLGALGAGFPQMGGALQQQAEQAYREPTRMTVTRQAADVVINNLPADIPIGLVTVEACPQARSHGRFSPGQRGALRSRIAGLTPQEGTPLASGLAAAAETVDGVNRDALIVVVTDGEEGCGVDPCALARQLVAQKPRLRINVVGITPPGSTRGLQTAQCIAAAGKGQLFSARSAHEIRATIQAASKNVMTPEGCPRE